MTIDNRAPTCSQETAAVSRQRVEESEVGNQRPTRGGLGARVLVAAAVIPLLVVVVCVGGVPLVLLVGLATLVGLGEFYRLAERCGIRAGRALGMLAGLFALLAMWGGAARALPGVLILAAAAMMIRGLPSRGMPFVGGTAVTLMGVVYLSIPLGHLLLLRAGPGGWRAALLPFLLTWSCDTGAYFVGSAWGRHRLAPSLSPKKSWEGAVGGLVVSVGAAFLSRWWFAPFLSVGDCLGLGLLIGAVAQMGDLVESRMKREAGLDDASGLIPGHGGLLDRLDSLLFAIPATYYYLVLRQSP